jgi:hypothetical protein
MRTALRTKNQTLNAERQRVKLPQLETAKAGKMRLIETSE